MLDCWRAHGKGFVYQKDDEVAIRSWTSTIRENAWRAAQQATSLQTAVPLSGQVTVEQHGYNSAQPLKQHSRG
jgi:hypothetical protein